MTANEVHQPRRDIDPVLLHVVLFRVLAAVAGRATFARHRAALESSAGGL